MRWAIDGSALGSGRGGDETYVRAVLDGLRATTTPDESIVVVRRGSERPSADGVTTDFTVGAKGRSGAAFYGYGFGRALRGSGCQAAFSMTHAPLGASTPVALVIMDLSFEHLHDAYPRLTRMRLRAIVGRQARTAAVVVTISEYSRQDIVETYGVDPHRVLVVPGAVGDPLRVSAEAAAEVRHWRTRVGITNTYLLYLGNLHPRKNVARAIRAFADADLGDAQLVIAGARWWGADEEAALRSLSTGRVVLTGRVSDVQREVLLAEATALVYPSLFEGFGLPPLEAMRRGVPVVASNATAVPETVGDAALLVDPLDCASMTSAIQTAFHDAAVRERLIAAGHRRAAEFTVVRAGIATRQALLAARHAETMPSSPPAFRRPARAKTL